MATHPLLTSALRFGGGDAPSSAVVLFHGLGGDRDSLAPLATVWQARVPEALFVVMQAPNVRSTGGFDWFSFAKGSQEFPTEEAWLAEIVLPSIRSCQESVSAALDVLTDELGIDRDRLVLAGFSQGAAVASYSGLALGVVGVIPMGGPCPPRQQLLTPPGSTQVCLITGDKDPNAPHAQLQEVFGSYPGAVHVIPGLSHTITDSHVQIGGDFLASMLG